MHEACQDDTVYALPSVYVAELPINITENGVRHMVQEALDAVCEAYSQVQYVLFYLYFRCIGKDIGNRMKQKQHETTLENTQKQED